MKAPQLRLIGVPYRQCSGCGESDPAKFGTDKTRRDWLSFKCRRCLANAMNARRKRNPEHVRMIQKKSVYKIDFPAMWRMQEGKCAACGDPMLPKGKDALAAVVDHDHRCCSGHRSCGKCVRGLIHSRCNFAIGHVREDASLMLRLAGYLERIGGPEK